MNENLRKIMEEVGYAAPHLASRAQELAFRIIEECARVIEPSEEHRADASWGFLGGDEGVELLDAKVEQIKAHFGLQ